MNERLNYDYTGLSLARLEAAVSTLAAVLTEGTGARIGESAVVSRRVHQYSPDKPEIMFILRNSDAGQVFYRRGDTNKVLHVDIFHQCGLVAPERVAQAIKEAVEGYHLQLGLDKLYTAGVNCDYIDIQTEGGGGRVTGSLRYGKREYLRQAHTNHVHLAILLTDKQLASIFFIIQAVEYAIMDSGLELRRNERIVSIDNDTSDRLDCSDYSTESDSLLKGNQQENNYKLSSEEGECSTKADAKPSGTPEGKECDSTQSSMDNQRFVGLDAAAAVGEKGEYAILKEHKRDLRDKVKAAEDYLDVIKRLELKRVRFTTTTQASTKRSNGKTGMRHIEQPEQKRIGELAVPETIYAAAVRMAEEGEKHFHVTGRDLRICCRSKSREKEICLIIDASASMKGSNIEAAKHLAYQLLYKTSDRICVIRFQGNRADVMVPFTRNRQRLEQGLSDIVTMGMTPLALGLKAALDYMKKEQAHNPLMVLITDGIPDNITYEPQQSLKDAMAVAKDIKKAGYQFLAIGLKLHQKFLTELSQAAGGKVHVFRDFDKYCLENIEDIVIKSRTAQEQGSHP